MPTASRPTSLATTNGPAAVGRIAELNDAERNTGRARAKITQHPGVDDRLRRFRAATRRPAAHA